MYIHLHIDYMQVKSTLKCALSLQIDSRDTDVKAFFLSKSQAAFGIVVDLPCFFIHVLMRDERRKEERSKQDQTNNKAKQHSIPKAVTFF